MCCMQILFLLQPVLPSTSTEHHRGRVPDLPECCRTQLPLPLLLNSSHIISDLQNIPVTAITEYVRDPQFCKEEWDQVRCFAMFSKPLPTSVATSVCSMFPKRNFTQRFNYFCSIHSSGCPSRWRQCLFVSQSLRVRVDPRKAGGPFACAGTSALFRCAEHKQVFIVYTGRHFTRLSLGLSSL